MSVVYFVLLRTNSMNAFQLIPNEITKAIKISVNEQARMPRMPRMPKVAVTQQEVHQRHDNISK